MMMKYAGTGKGRSVFRYSLYSWDYLCKSNILFEVWTSLTFESWPNLIKYVNKTIWDFSKMIITLFNAIVKIWKMLNSTYEKNLSSKECQFLFEQQKQQALKGSNSKYIFSIKIIINPGVAGFELLNFYAPQIGLDNRVKFRFYRYLHDPVVNLSFHSILSI